MKVQRLKSYRKNLLKNNLVIFVGRVLIQNISIEKSLETLNIKMLKRLSYSMNELLNFCLLSNMRRFEAIMSQFEGRFCFEIYHWKI